jgi:hypothetical protein
MGEPMHDLNIMMGYAMLLTVAGAIIATVLLNILRVQWNSKKCCLNWRTFLKYFSERYPVTTAALQVSLLALTVGGSIIAVWAITRLVS